ncbi:MAG: phosphatidylglycerophosphatase A [Proteobacteria bacterium]|nr:phosphatidylglycerophosphatase A [Pseudomonadota bacterium]NDC25362.1 phosphatidylglycerophosphatase A [Pseudomonadota bacterium]NDD05193.1 phosphatidylglycerophosphatase A [Pseudomonadota bacterium]NDG26443.1 phosphatidylglycerophosphatase A [Pseudomonadota bacterium]
MGSEKTKVRLGQAIRKMTAVLIASGGLTGFFPAAPGTCGSVVGVGLIFLGKDLPLWALVFLVLALLVMGVWAAGEMCQIMKKKDASQVVIDEIVGMMITMVGLPVTPYWMIGGFLVFRLFDIVKPSPARYFDDKVAGGWGVMMDDVIAGIYGNILLHFILRAQI